jgi:hypothetical protein
VTLQIGPLRFFHSTVGVWDVMSILPKDLPKIDGVLSLKTFQYKIFSLDLSGNCLVVETQASLQKKRKRMTLLPTRFATGLDGNELTIFTGIPRDRHLYWFLFDSGNLNDLLLSHQTAATWMLQTDTVTQRKELGTVSVLLGNRKMQGKAASEKIIYDGALNFALLQQAKFTIDFRRKQLWME